MRIRLSVAALLGLSVSVAAAYDRAPDISGTWDYFIDTGNGMHRDGTLAFTQNGYKLSGTYSGSMGDYRFAGAINGMKLTFSFEKAFPRQLQPVRITYTGTIETPARITGVFDHPKGSVNWTATKMEPRR